MRSTLSVLVALLFTSVAGSMAGTAGTDQQQARGNPVVELDGQSVDGMIAEFMAQHDVPGMSLAIVQAPYITRVTGFGVADTLSNDDFSVTIRARPTRAPLRCAFALVTT